MTGQGPVVAVVPAWNEAATIGAVVAALRALPLGVSVVVVDDGSTDGTGDAARAAGAVVLTPPFNLGIGGAVQTGLRWAAARGARAVVQVDGDGQHPAAQATAVLQPVLEGRADVCIGSRFLRGEGDQSTTVRRAGIAWLAFLVRMRCGRSFSDPTSGFRACGPRALAWLAEEYPEDYPEPQVLAPLVRRGFRIEEVPVRMAARGGGKSSIRGLGPLLYMAKVSVAVVLGSTK